MADLRLITILPSSSVSGVQASPVAPGTAQGSPSLASLPPGTVLSGFIVNRDASGNPILRTDTGDIAFSSNFFLKIGSEVVIRVENSGGNTLAHILTVNGQPPEVAENLSAFAQQEDVIVSRGLTAAPPPANAAAAEAAQAPVPAGATEPATAITVTGTLISPPHGEGTAAPSLPPGTQLTLKLVSLVLPGAAPTGSAPQGSPLSYSAYARAAGVPASAAVAPPQAAAAPQAAASPAAIALPEETAAPAVTIAAAAAEPELTQPNQPPAAIAQPQAATTNAPTQTAAAVAATPAAPAIPFQPGQQIAATVIGNEVTGEAVVQTQGGIVRLQPGTSLPTGSRATFEITQIAPPAPQDISAAGPAAATTATVATAPAPLMQLARQWTSLQTIFGLLAGRESLSGMDFVAGNMPWLAQTGAPAPQSLVAPQSMQSGLLLFINALRNNDFANWLGRDNVQWLQAQGHDDLLKKAAAEFDSIGRQFAEPAQQRWQALFFPVAVEGDFQQARLFVKRDRKQGGNKQEKTADDTRFVVELDLSQLGEMQLDGFVRRREGDIRFDLMIRSLTPLPQDVQQDILQIYNDTGELTGYKGSLVFQSVREFPVNPMEEIMAHGLGTVVA